MEINFDESLIPFRDHIILRQYLKQRCHKYGIQLINKLIN